MEDNSIIKDYRNKLILAPMVRCNSLAFRLLALENGADIVYSEEMVDFKIITAERRINKFFNTIEYCVPGTKKPLFQTSEKEKGRVVFQIGTNNAARALQACKRIENDVSAIDVNMGCPKDFSVHGGMGAALLSKPDTIKEILTTLVQNLSKPVTCKIRCLPSLEDTIKLCQMIEECGVKAIGVHGRFQTERSSQPNHNDYINEIAKVIKIPIIANGGSNEIKSYEDIEKFRASCGASSVMIARQAMWNCSVFRKEGMLPIDAVLKRFLELSLETNNFFNSVKYATQNMLHNELTSPRGVAVLASMVDEEIYVLFSMLDELKSVQEKYEEFCKNEAAAQVSKRKITDEEDPSTKKSKCDENNGESDNKDDRHVICMHAKFQKKLFRDGTCSPKSILHTFSQENKLPKPVYRTEEKERSFKSVLEFNNVFYSTPYWEASKQLTEQAVAIVALEMLGVDYKSISETHQQQKNNNLNK